MAKLIDKKVIEEARKFLGDPSTDFKHLYIDLDKKRNSIKLEGLKDFCTYIIPKIQDIEYLTCNSNFTKKHLESLYIILNDFEKYIGSESKQDKKRLNSLKPLFKKTFNDLHIDLKFLFDHFEAILHLITFDLVSKNKFNDMIWAMNQSNMLEYKEYQVLKIFNKIRNMFMHNSHNHADTILTLKEHIPLFIVVLEEINLLQVTLVKKYSLRIALANALLGYDNYKIPDNKMYNTLNILYAVRKQENDLNIKALKFNIDIGMNINYNDEGTALVKRYSYYLITLIELTNNKEEVSFSIIEDIINRNLLEIMLGEKDKETIDLIKRIMDVKLNPDYVTSDVGTLQRMISKII